MGPASFSAIQPHSPIRGDSGYVAMVQWTIPIQPLRASPRGPLSLHLQSSYTHYDLTSYLSFCSQCLAQWDT